MPSWVLVAHQPHAVGAKEEVAVFGWLGSLAEAKLGGRRAPLLVEGDKA